MSIAYGSALELETQIIIAKKIKLTDPEYFFSCEKLLNEVLKMLNSMTAKLKLKSQVSTLDANISRSPQLKADGAPLNISGSAAKYTWRAS